MIRSLMKLFVITAISSTAIAQQAQVTGKFEMPWAMSSVTQIDALRGPSSTGAWSVISKQTAMIDLNVSFGTIAASPTGVPITAIFPGQTTAWTATAIRLTVCAKGSLIVCEQPMKFRLPLPTPYTVRAGHPAVFKITLKAASSGDWAFAEDAAVVVGPVTPPPVVLPPSPPTLVLGVTPTPLTGTFAQGAPCTLPFTVANGSTMLVTVTWADNIPQLLDLIPKAHQAPVIIPASGSTAFTLTCDSGTKGTFSGVGTITSGAIVLSLPISWTVQ